MHCTNLGFIVSGDTHLNQFFQISSFVTKYETTNGVNTRQSECLNCASIEDAQDMWKRIDEDVYASSLSLKQVLINYLDEHTVHDCKYSAVNYSLDIYPRILRSNKKERGPNFGVANRMGQSMVCALSTQTYHIYIWIGNESVMTRSIVFDTMQRILKCFSNCHFSFN